MQYIADSAIILGYAAAIFAPQLQNAIPALATALPMVPLCTEYLPQIALGAAALMFIINGITLANTQGK